MDDRNRGAHGTDANRMTGADTPVAGRSGGGGLYELVTTSRRLLLIVFVVCAAAGYLLSGLMRRAYRAEAVVVPVQSGTQGLMSGLSGLLGSSALAGLGMAPTADKNESKETLQSRALIRQFITERFGKDNIPGEPRVYKTTAKNAQEAHEGIRPTSVRYSPAVRWV